MTIRAKAIILAGLLFLPLAARADLLLEISDQGYVGERAIVLSNSSAPVLLTGGETLTIQNISTGECENVDLVPGDTRREIIDKINAHAGILECYVRVSDHDLGFGMELVSDAVGSWASIGIASSCVAFNGTQSGFGWNVMDCGWGRFGFFLRHYSDDQLLRMDHLLDDGGVSWYGARPGAACDWSHPDSEACDIYLIPDGAEVNDTWPARWFEGDNETEATRLPDETVTVPAGTFDAVVVSYAELSEPFDTHRIWFADGVGPVKIELSTGVEELADYDVSAGGAGLYPLAIGNWWSYGGAPAPRVMNRLDAYAATRMPSGERSGRSLTLRVPADQPTIKAAMSVAEYGDTVLVAEGTYCEWGIDLAYGVTLRGEPGDAELVVIDAQGWGRILFANVREGRIENLTIRNGGHDLFGCGLVASNTELVVNNCRFIGNAGSCVYLNNSGHTGTMPPPIIPPARFSDCLFQGGAALAMGDSIVGGGFYCNAGDPVFTNCVFIDNENAGLSAVNGSEPVFVGCETTNGIGFHFMESEPELVDCRITHNAGDGIVYRRNSEVDIEDCEISFNGGTGIHGLESSGYVRGSTIHANHDYGMWTRYTGTSGWISLRGTLITGTLVGEAYRVENLDYIGAGIQNCDIWGNAGGDWTGPLAYALVNPDLPEPNYNEDPLYCDPDSGDLTVDALSICLAHDIGAYGQGCGGTAVTDGTTPGATRLAANYPNPFNPTTKIAFELAAPADVTLRVYDTTGRLVRTLLASEARDAGRHETIWEGRDNAGARVSSGVYFYRLEAGAFSDTRKMTLLK